MKDRWTVKGVKFNFSISSSNCSPPVLFTASHFSRTHPNGKKDSRNPFARRVHHPPPCLFPLTSLCVHDSWCTATYHDWVAALITDEDNQNKRALQNWHIPHSGERERPGRWLLRSRTTKSIYRIYLIHWWGGQNVRSMTIIAKRETSPREDAVILLLPRICTGGGCTGMVEGEKEPEKDGEE